MTRRPMVVSGPRELGGSSAEEWRDVPGFAGYYEVSNLGRVRSLSRAIRTAYGATKFHEGRVMVPVPDKDGYPRVVLRVDGKHQTRRVHRLVCEAFNGPPNILHRNVDHIDGDRANAHAANLRWVSHAENMHFRHRKTGTRGEKIGGSKLTELAVREIRNGRCPAKQLAEKFGVSVYAIYDVRNGRRWAHVV
jgi:hypothetical protein